MTLSELHQAVLATRSIDPPVIAARGYVTVSAQTKMAAYDFTARGPVAGTINKSTGESVLIIPLYDIAGARSGSPYSYQARPDAPRRIAGKPAKYEMPPRVSPPADINPLVAKNDWLDDLAAPVIITEGVPKADAILTVALRGGHSACPVALVGVTGARVRIIDKGARILHPDLAAVALAGRDVHIAFDSDYRTNPTVYGEAIDLAAELQGRGCNVHFLDVPPTATGDKQGVDDWLASTGFGFQALLDLSRLFDRDEHAGALAAVAAVADTRPRPAREIVVDHKVHCVVETRHATQAGVPDRKIELAGFSGWAIHRRTEFDVTDTGGLSSHEDGGTVRVCLQWTEDSGAVTTRTFDLPEGKTRHYDTWTSRCNGLSSRFIDPSSTALVFGAILGETDPTVAERPDEIAQHLAVADCGWVLIPRTVAPGEPSIVDNPGEDGRDMKLHYIGANGMTGAEGPIDTTVRSVSDTAPRLAVADDEWADRRMGIYAACVEGPSTFASGTYDPDKDTGTKGVAGGADSEETRPGQANLSDLWRIGIAWVSRSILPMRPSKNPLFLCGAPGAGKTATALAITSGYDPKWSRRPFASFKSTPVGLELALSHTRHAGVLIDDLAISSDSDLDRHTAMMDRIVRAVHDGAEVQRGTKDLSVRRTSAPQGALMFSGEQPPSSERTKSLIERLMWVFVDSGMLSEFELDWLNDEIKGKSRMEPAFLSEWHLVIHDLIRFIAHTAETQGWDCTSMAGVEAGVTAWLDEPAQVIADYALNEAVTQIAADLGSGFGDLVRAKYQRTHVGLLDLARGAALFEAFGIHHGYFPAPPAGKRSMTAMSFARSLLRVVRETVATIERCDPRNRVAADLANAFRSHRAYVTMHDGTPPPADLADAWGWSLDADRRPRESPRAALVGRIVETSKSDWVMWIDPDQIAGVLASGSSKLSRRELLGHLSAAEGLLYRPLDNGTVRITVHGKQQRGVFLNLSALGLPVPESGGFDDL